MVTQHLGNFGQARTALDMTFGYFGAKLRVHPHGSDLALVEFMADAATVDMDDPAQAVTAMGKMVEFLKEQVHPDDWSEFWRLARAHGQRLEDLMAVSRQLTEAVARFPTGQPSALPSKGKRGRKKSKGGSSWPGGLHAAGTVHSANNLREMAPARAVRLLDGRPDLQVVVLRKAEEDVLRAG